MLRSTWLTLALVAFGLWASLVPQVSYQSASSGAPSENVLIAWPGWAVQQEIGSLSGQIGSFQYWASAQAHGPEVSVHASLVDATTLEVLRQKSVIITPAYIPVERTLSFPSYVVPEGQRLLLQLQVADVEDHFVAIQLAAPHPELGNLMVNGVPDSGDGPLAFAHLETGSGLRAAVHGEQHEQIRLALAIALSVLAGVAHPWSSLRLRRIGSSIRQLLDVRRKDRTESSGTFARVLTTPWYPWPAAAIPILHFLSSNDIHFSPNEALLPLTVTLLVVFGTVIGLRLLLGDWHRPAAAATVVTVVFFLYGHVERTLQDRIDERLFFSASVVLCAAVVAQAVRSGGFLSRGTPFFNVVAAVLLVLQALNLAGGASSQFGSPANRVAAENLTSHLFPGGIPEISGDRPDIYYIILDAYGRNDALVDFDNSSFLGELEDRGFYIASEATSNYVSTPHSLASSLNMSYLHELGPRTPASHSDMMNLVYYNSVAAILKTLGYTYVKLESGHQFTSKAPLADIFVTFGPSGVRVVSNQDELSSSVNPLVSRIFVRELIRTTALRPIIQSQFLSDDESTYDWWSPHRALDMFEFLSQPIGAQGPKFVFAHISKPKVPATFDRHGSFVLGTLATDEFSDDHDPSVPDAYAGQLIYINSLVLRLIDSILRNEDNDPIIVIAGDHNRRGTHQPLHPILAAFHLPVSVNEEPAAYISSVNHFRFLFRSAFNFDIDPLVDRTIAHSGVHWDFTTSPEGRDG
jgi:hypothetical protein